jgi:hypothetical protein
MLEGKMYYIHWIAYGGLRCEIVADDMTLLHLELIFVCEPTCWIDQDPGVSFSPQSQQGARISGSNIPQRS